MQLALFTLAATSLACFVTVLGATPVQAFNLRSVVEFPMHQATVPDIMDPGSSATTQMTPVPTLRSQTSTDQTGAFPALAAADLQLLTTAFALGTMVFTGLQAAAVTVSLALLYRQVKLSTLSARINTYHEAINAFAAIESRISQDGRVARLYEKGAYRPNQLNAAERRQFSELMASTFNLYDSMYFQYKNRLLPPELWSGWCMYLREQLTWPGVADWWHRKHHLYSDSFVDYIEAGNCPPSDLGMKPRRGTSR